MQPPGVLKEVENKTRPKEVHKYHRVSIRTSFIARQVDSNMMFNWLDSEKEPIKVAISNLSCATPEKSLRISNILTNENELIQVNVINTDENRKSCNNILSLRKNVEERVTIEEKL